MMTLENLSKSTVQDLIGYAEGVRAKKKDGFKNVEPALRGECAKRRMKLFDDAEHYGAQIFCNGQWIAAIVRDYDQAHTFGRLKPKVDKKTGKIMPECNLRQDEGITKENLAIQEDPAWPWVKDGLGTAYDNMPNEMGQCVMGGVSFWGKTPQYCKWGPGLKPVANWNSSGYFQTKQRDELMPLIVYMECSTGKLFCSNLKAGGGQYSVGNGWYQYDFNTAINAQNDGGLRNKLQNASFKEIYNVANDASFEAYAAAGKRWNAIKDPPPKFSEG